MKRELPKVKYLKKPNTEKYINRLLYNDRTG